MPSPALPNWLSWAGWTFIAVLMAAWIHDLAKPPETLQGKDEARAKQDERRLKLIAERERERRIRRLWG